MSLSEWGLNNRDAERLQQVLQDDERVVMVAKPRVSMPLSEVIFNTLPGWVLAAFLGAGAYMFGQHWWVVVALSSPFWLVALVMLSVPLRYRFRMSRTLYVLTDKRAVVFEQLSLWRNRCVCWPLFPGLVKKVTQDARNLGSLIFDYELRWKFGRKVQREPMRVGFLTVPQPERVLRILEEQVAAIPADQAPFAYRPPVLKTPAPKLDAWGNPTKEEAARDDRRFLIGFGMVWILFSAVFLVKGLLMLHDESLLESEGKQTTAVVVKMRKDTSGGGGRRSSSSVSYYPTLRFADATGKVHKVEYEVSTDNFPIGEKLPITYLPSDPELLRLVDDGLSPGACLTLSSSLLILVGCGLMFIGYRMKQKS